MKAYRIICTVSVFILVGLCFVDGVTAGMSDPLLPKDGFDMSRVEQGRYLLKIAGCNDCHTSGYAPMDGNVAEEDWLKGDAFGWRGPWGTTYGSNLRIFINSLTEEQWVATAHALKVRPPMPWFNLNAMDDEDLKAIYQFVSYLGPDGEPAPAYLPPDVEPKPPFASFPSPPPSQ